MIQLSNIPLRELGIDNMPIGMASGCLIKYTGKTLLLTVQHATGNFGNWAIELEYVQGQGTKLWRLGTINFLTKATLPSLIFKDVDFAYVEVPDTIESFFQECTPATGFGPKLKRHVFSDAFGHLPDIKDKYAFSGQVMAEYAGNILFGENRVYQDLEYVSTTDDIHTFRIPFKHPGHVHFKGTSGAPILNSHREIVALVIGGDTDTDVIYGIDINKYKILIDILINSLT
jgi:hypothetical protein